MTHDPVAIIAEFDHAMHVPLSEGLSTLRLFDATDHDRNQYTIERSKLALAEMAFDCGLIVLNGNPKKERH